MGQSGGPDARLSPDSIVAEAARAIDGGRPWQATRLLIPLYRESGFRSASVLLTAARAAAQWEGWGSVVRLLETESWLDTLDDGAGRALLARARLERGDVGLAVLDARRAVQLATDKTRGERLVTYARALDRARQLDSAASRYLEAAAKLPELADWLELRAAGVTSDSAARRRIYEGIESPVASGRSLWTEALALERSGDQIGAAKRYAALGAPVAAARARLATSDSVHQAEARANLFELLAGTGPRSETAEAIELFDRSFLTRTPAEEQRIARRAAAINQLERAARGFAAAGPVLLTDSDRFTYAMVLARLRRPADAIPLFAAVTSAELRGDAAYQQARMLLRSGQAGQASKALIEVAVKFASDPEPAATALFLAGDIAADRASDDSARSLFLRAGTLFPTTPFGRRAGFQAALIAYLDRNYGAALAEFDQLSTAPVEVDESLAGTYWAGRALAALRDTLAARQRWTRVIARAPDSYYAMLAADRLGAPFLDLPAPPAAPDSTGRLPPPLRRAQLLGQVGLDAEARLELDGFATGRPSEPEALLEAARGLAAGDWHARAAKLAARALERGAPFNGEIARLLYPLPFRPVLLAEAEAAEIDPALVAGVIRQESAFDPTARSSADARGLMQVLPSVGADLAKSVGIEWDPILLYQPDVNLGFGIQHLAMALDKLVWPVRALAAYNAGVDRVERWQSLRGVREDPEVFVERIPFAETRDYVRKVLRNQAVYRALYRDQ